MKNDFNPVKEERDGVKARRVVWSTKTIEAAIKGLEDGRKLVANPFYENNSKILKGDLVFQRTKEEIEEWKKCAADIHYFSNTYCKLMTPEGIKKVKMRGYQEGYLDHLMKYRLSIYLAARQCGKTTTSSIFLLWYILFNVDKNALVIADVFSHAKDIMEKTKAIFVELPYFLRPGVYKWNESQIVLDNGCKLIAQATTPTAGIGYTLHCVLWDEVAHTAPNIKDKLYNFLLPTIQAGKARLMLTSTQGGLDLFYRIYKAAEQHMNEFGAYKTDWDEIPEWNPEKRCWEKRDEAWHQMQVANYGSEEAFNTQFGTNFDINANTLINTKILRKRQREAITFVNKDLFGVTGSEHFFWKPDFEPMDDLRNSFITVTADLAEGVGLDYTVFLFNRMIPGKKDECVGMFRCNTMNLDKASIALMELDIKYLHPDQHCISLEYNTYGELFIMYLMENRNKYPSCANFDESNIVKYYNDNMTKFTMGVKLNTATKSIGCKMFKDEFERDVLVNRCVDFLFEAENFSDSNGNGTYKASFGHDDIMMAEIQMVHAKQSRAYKYLRSEFESRLELGLVGTPSPQPQQAQPVRPMAYPGQIDMQKLQQYSDGQYFDPTKVFTNMNDIYAAMNQRYQQQPNYQQNYQQSGMW